MGKKLPHREFHWINQSELEKIDILNYDENSDFGTVLEVMF